MNEITSVQSKALKTWAERRDEILREISVLKDEANTVVKTNTNGHQAFSELQGRIQHTVGRLDELDKLEEQKKTSLSKDVSDLLVQKSTLQGDVAVAKIELQGLDSKKSEVFELLNSFDTIFSTLLDNANGLNVTIGNMHEKAKVHDANVDTIMQAVRNSGDIIVEKNQENVKTTNIVLEKLHKWLFEISKPLPIRRAPGK